MINESVKLVQECIDYANFAGISITSVSCNQEVFSVDFYDKANDLSVYLYRYSDGWYRLAKHLCHPAITKSNKVQFDTLAHAVQDSTFNLLALRKDRLSFSEAKTFLK